MLIFLKKKGLTLSLFILFIYFTKKEYFHELHLLKQKKRMYIAYKNVSNLATEF